MALMTADPIDENAPAPTPPPPAGAPIDLSAGLVPMKVHTPPPQQHAAQPAAKPAQSLQPIDLSGGLVPASATPVATPTPAAAAPPTDWRDRVLSFLTREKADTAAAALAPSSSAADKAAAISDTTGMYDARRALGGAASIVLHPWDTASTMADQAHDILTAANAKIVEATGGQTTQKEKDAVDRVKAMGKGIYDQLTTDPEGFVAEQVGQGALLHGFSKIPEVGIELAKKSPKIAAAVGRWQTDTTAADTRSIVRKTAADNAQAVTDAADKTTQNIQDQRVAQATVDADNQAKTNRVAELNRKRLEAHGARVDTVRQANDAATAAAEQKTQDLRAAAQADFEKNQAALNADHEEATKAGADAQETEQQRTELAQQEQTLRNRLHQRLQTAAAGAKSSVDNMFDTVREKVGDAETPLAPLLEPVAAAEEKFAAEPEKVVKIQRAMRQAMAADSGSMVEQSRRDVMQSVTGSDKTDYNSLPTDKKALVDQLVQKDLDHYGVEQSAQQDGDRTISFQHARAISSELGQQIYKEMSSDHPDYEVVKSLREVKQQADAMAQHMASDAGVGSLHKKALQTYGQYRDIFTKPAGPSSSGSEVAQGLNATDAFHATQPFLQSEPAAYNAARQLAVTGEGIAGGAKLGGGVGKLIDNLRNLKSQQDALPSQKQTAKAISAIPEGGPAPAELKEVKPVPPTLKPDPVAKPVLTPQLKPALPPPKIATPDIINLGPEELAKIKGERVLEAVDKLRKLQIYRAATMVGGAVSLVTGLASMAMDSGTALSHALQVGGGISAISAGLYGPVVSRLLESPKVILALTKVTKADLAELSKLPMEQRQGTARMLEQASLEGLRTGKLPAAPWLKVLRALGLGATAVGTAAATNIAPAVQEKVRQRIAAAAAKKAAIDADLEKDLQELGGDNAAPVTASDPSPEENTQP